MFNACIPVFDTTDIAVMSAAVADYTPVNVATDKIKKREDIFSVELKKTKDILKHLGTIKKEGQLLAGFALETRDERKNALKKLAEKNADLIILNSLNDSGAGFGGDTNKIAIFDKSGGEHYFDTKSKKEVAVDIVNTIIHLYYA
jgi:phosphopantothenoylcysteine decarboxylase/phosphopantothenate--cysteine ligase